MNIEKRTTRRALSRTETKSESNLVLFGQPHTLSRHMSKLVNRKVFSDVHFFVGPNREKIYGHRCVLSARNEIFRQLLLNEPVKTSYEFPTVAPVTFLLLIYFLYTNSISFDRLDIYEVYELMKTAEQYKCPELEKLAEFQVSLLLDPKTAFEFLSKSFQLNRQLLKNAAREYIEDYSAALLNPSNKDILMLTPAAMQSLLESSLLEIDEMQVIEVACYWAENYLTNAKENSADLERGHLRASILHIEPNTTDSVQDSSLDSTPLYVTRDRDWPDPGSALMRQALEDVAKVMRCLRLALLQPNDLAKLEESQLTKKLIPQECFINAWRQLALQASRIPSRDGQQLITEQRGRKAPVVRSIRSKSFSEQPKRSRSVVSGRAND